MWVLPNIASGDVSTPCSKIDELHHRSKRTYPIPTSIRRSFQPSLSRFRIPVQKKSHGIDAPCPGRNGMYRFTQQHQTSTIIMNLRYCKSNLLPGRKRPYFPSRWRRNQRSVYKVLSIEEKHIFLEVGGGRKHFNVSQILPDTTTSARYTSGVNNYLIPYFRHHASVFEEPSIYLTEVLKPNDPRTKSHFLEKDILT